MNVLCCRCVIADEVREVTAKRDQMKNEFEQLMDEIQNIVNENKTAKDNVDKFQKFVTQL